MCSSNNSEDDVSTSHARKLLTRSMGGKGRMTNERMKKWSSYAERHFGTRLMWRQPVPLCGQSSSTASPSLTTRTTASVARAGASGSRQRRRVLTQRRSVWRPDMMSLCRGTSVSDRSHSSSTCPVMNFFAAA